MLTVAGIAETLGVCKMTVYRLIGDGHIPAVKIGKSYRVSEKDFSTYLRRVRISGKPPGRSGTKASR